MKARVKATGEIVEINETHTEIFTDVHDNAFSIDEIDFNVVERKAPATRARRAHQYAGMAMNALLLTNNIRNGDLEGMRECNTNAMAIAHALVEKYKKEEEK